MTIEALKVGDDTEALVEELRRVAGDNPFREMGAGRWELELNDSVSDEAARESIESQLDELDGAQSWRENLRVI